MLKNVVPGATLKNFTTPKEALDAFYTGDVSILGGGTLWLAANSRIDKTALLPFRPYGRSGISCIVNQNNGKLLSSTNIALGQMMQAYMDGDAGTRRMINRWIGPGSDVGLSQESIRSLYGLILVESTHTEQFRRLMADMTSGVETCHKSCEYFGLCGGGNGSNKFWEHGTLASSETNACRFGTQIPTQVLLERFEEGPPLTPLTPNPSGA